jgi:hypothetical protein
MGSAQSSGRVNLSPPEAQTLSVHILVSVPVYKVDNPEELGESIGQRRHNAGLSNDVWLARGGRCSAASQSRLSLGETLLSPSEALFYPVS